MLVSLTMRNWQAHVHRLIEFDPRVTVLVGPNGAGKSAAVRALRWLALGVWDGRTNTHVTWGADYSHVEAVTLQDSKLVTAERYKGASGHWFRVGGRVVEYDQAQRSGVPKLVSDALRLTDDNFQLQFDPGYWFVLTAGQAARELNRVVNLEAIDATLDAAGAECRRQASRVEESRERVQAIEAELEETAWVEDADKQLRAIERAEQRVEALYKQFNNVFWLIGQIEQARWAAENAGRVHELGMKVIRTEFIINSRQSELQDLKTLLADLDRLRTRQTWLNDEIRRLTRLTRTPPVGVIPTCPTCGQTIPRKPNRG